MVKETAASVRARQNKRNKKAKKNYLPNKSVTGDRVRNSEVRFICPKTGDILEIIESNTFSKSEFNGSLNKKVHDISDIETEEVLNKLDDQKTIERFLK